MKKTLIVLLTAVLAMSMLFVSCSNETKIDSSPVKISFNSALSRGLTSSQITPSVNELYWYYKANKTVDSVGEEINLGATNGWTRVTTGDDKGLNRAIEFAQGRWDFELQGRTEITEDVTKAVYYGSASDVLIQKINEDIVPITINVSQLTDGDGSVVISNRITVKKNTSDSSGYTPTHYKYKATADENYCEDIPLTITEGEDGTKVTLSAGTYDFVVMYKGIDTDSETLVKTEIIYASSPITVTVSANIKTLISGSLEVVTAPGQFDVEVVGSKATASVVPSETEAVSVVVPITPSEEQGKDTTVTFVKGALPSDAKKVVTEVKTVEEAQAANFSVSTGKTAVAAIDLKITGNSGDVKAIEGGKTVTVTTYILKGLSQNSLNLVYTGVSNDGMIHRVTEYEPETGKLVFQTNHFSEFFVESDAVCYSEKNNKGYYSLVEAAKESSSTDTIHILCDIDLTSFNDVDGDGFVIEELYGTLDGSKGNGDCYKIKMPESDDIRYFIGKHDSLTVSNIKIVLGTRTGILSLISATWPSNANVKIDNVDYSSSDANHSYAIGHNSSVYGSYFAWSGSVEFKNCDVNLNLDGISRKADANSAVFYGGYHLGSTTVSVTDCSYTGEYIGPYIALVISNAQGMTEANTTVSGLVNNGRLYGLLEAHAVGAQNTKNISSFDVSDNGTIANAAESKIVITQENGSVSFTPSQNEKANSYILQLAGVRKIFDESGINIAQNYNYDIRFTNVTPNSSTPLYRMIDIDTAKAKYDFEEGDFNGVTWKKTGSAYDGDGEYCVAAKGETSYYVLRFTSTNGYSYSIDTMPSKINVMVLDAAEKLIEIKSK